MLQPRDIVLLLAITHAADDWTVRSLGEPLGVGSGATHRALVRLADVGLYDPARRQINLAATDEFIRHAAHYLFHRDIGKPTRGVPTAWGASPLNAQLASSPSDDAAPVWPASTGTVRGPSLEPLIENATSLIERAPALAEQLTLLDAVAVGDTRTRALASDLLMQRLAAAATAS